MRALILAAAVLALSPLVRADENELAAQLEAKGMSLRRDATGSVTDIQCSSSVTMTLEDYRLFARFPKLQRLRLSPGGFRLNDESLAAIGALPGLESFFAGSPQLTDAGLAGFAGWKNLRYFGFDHWIGPDRSRRNYGRGLEHLSGLPQLEAVRLGGCNVDDEAPRALAGIKSLQKVDLFHTAGVTDEGVRALESLPQLKAVVLAPQFTPRITDRSLEYLSRIPTLEEISITGTWLTYEAGFVHLRKLPGLKTLKLKDVLAEEKDIERLKADHPGLAVEWNRPGEQEIAKLRRTFGARGRKPLPGASPPSTEGAATTPERSRR